MRSLILFLLFFSFPAHRLLAQSNQIKGIVTDTKGMPILGATIKIKGNNKGTSAGADGSFVITAVPGTILVVSAVGHETQEVKTGSASTISIPLADDVKTLIDVVVTGVAQATSKEKLSFSLTKISAEKINTAPALDLSQTLRGKVAGIQISQTQGDDGASVFLRGAKSMFGNISPLIVIDGFVTNFSLSDLNPQDVESIEVVKGAAASALYGTRAEGGVIQVISKKGRGTMGVAITVDNEVGINNIQRTPDLATMHHYVTNDNDPYGFAYASGSTTSRIVNYKDNGFSVNLSPYKNSYNNTDALLGNNKYFSNYVSIATAGDKYNAFLSFRNQYTGGVAEPIDPNKKKSLQLRLQFRPTPKLETEVYINYFNEVKPSAAVTGNGQGTFFAASLQWEPFINLAAKNAAGNYNVRPDGWNIQGANLSNPMYEWSKREYTNNTDNYLAGGKLRYKVLKNLSVEVLGSIRKQNYTASDTYPRGFETTTTSESLNNGNVSLGYNYYQMMNGQAQINYNTRFGDDVTFGVTGKMVYEEWYEKEFGVSGYDFSRSSDIYVIGNTRTDTRTGYGSDMFINQTVNYGYYLNFQTSWRDKVFLDALARVDQSSRYGIDEQTAFFPRVSLAYRITQDFDLGDAITELKARANYGAAGSVPSYNLKNSRVTVSASGFTLNQLASTDLQRSITHEWEFGIDAVLYKKINVQFNYALARSSGDVVRPPAFTPYEAAGVYKNFGVTKSNSLELEINGNAIETKNFSWDFGLTFGRVRSEIKSLGAGLPPFTDGLYWKDVNVSPFAMYGNKVLTSLSELEVDKTSGKVINAAGAAYGLSDFVVNSRGFVVLASQLGTKDEKPLLLQKRGANLSTVIGDAQPDFQVGFTNTFTFFKKLTLYGTVDWQQGGQKYDQTTQYLSFDGRTRIWQDYAASGLPLAFLQTLYNGNSYTSFWVSNSSYVALRELSLSYRIPGLAKTKLFKDVSLSIIGRNLLTWTDFKGSNPEGNHEYFPYPVYRTFSTRLIVNF